MQIFNESITGDEYTSLEYDFITGITIESIDTCSVTETYCDLQMLFSKLNGVLYIMEVMNDVGVAISEGVIGSTKDFFSNIKEKLKALIEKIKNFFSVVTQRVEVASSGAKEFIEKYASGIRKSLTKDGAEWVQYNKKYVIDDDEHKRIFKKVEAYMSDGDHEETAVDRKYNEIMNKTSSKNTAIDKDQQTNAPTAKPGEKPTNAPTAKPGEKPTNAKSQSDTEIALIIKDLEAYLDELEVATAKDIFPDAKSYEDVINAINNYNDKKDSDEDGLLDAKLVNDLLTYVETHIKSNLTAIKNAQTKTNTLIKNAEKELNKLDDTDSPIMIKVNRIIITYCMKHINFFQTLNNKRVSLMTTKFDYYVKLLKLYTKKNYKLVTGIRIEEKKDKKGKE